MKDGLLVTMIQQSERNLQHKVDWRLGTSVLWLCVSQQLLKMTFIFLGECVIVMKMRFMDLSLCREMDGAQLNGGSVFTSVLPVGDI